MKRKGIALPIDMLVVLAIAVIILIAVVAVFMGVWNPFATSQQLRANYNSACSSWVNTGCSGEPSDVVCGAALGVVLSTSADVQSCKDSTAAARTDAANSARVGCGCPLTAPA